MERKCLWAHADDTDDEAVVKEKQEKALAEHVARHPEDAGRTVADFKWILWEFIRSWRCRELRNGEMPGTPDGIRLRPKRLQRPGPHARARCWPSTWPAILKTPAVRLRTLAGW